MKWEYKSLKMATHTTFAAGKPDEVAFDKAGVKHVVAGFIQAADEVDDIPF